MKRIVVDTNVITAAMLSATGSNRDVIRACLSGKVQPLIGEALLNEYEDVLACSTLMSKSPLNASQRTTLFHAFLSVCEWVRVYFLWRPNLPDEADNHLVELAIAGGAEVVVTNNIRDLMHGQLAFPHLHILTPAQFLKTI